MDFFPDVYVLVVELAELYVNHVNVEYVIASYPSSPLLNLDLTV